MKQYFRNRQLCLPLALEERQTAAKEYFIFLLAFMRKTWGKPDNQFPSNCSTWKPKKEKNFDWRLLTFRWDAKWMQKASNIKLVKWVKAKKKDLSSFGVKRRVF